MLDLALGRQRSDILELFVDIFIGVKNKLAIEKGNVIGKTPVIIYWRVNIQIVFQADFIVLTAMPGSGMNASGAGLQGDMIAQDKKLIAFDHRMTTPFVFKHPGINIGDDSIILDTKGLHTIFHQLTCQDKNRIMTDINGNIFKIRM